MKIQNIRETARFNASTSFEVTPLRNASPLWLRRVAFVGPILASTVLGTWLAALATRGIDDPLRWPLLALVALNLLYMAVTGWPGVLGFLLHVTRRKMSASAAPLGQSRTAVVMPVHNEDPRAVFAAIEAMARGISDAGLHRVDLFVLSDTRDPAIARAEQEEFALLQGRAPSGPSLHYRRRTDNAGRKAGNLAEFCDTWGESYEYMLVLDADSLMGPATIGTLIGLMDANPRTGIIQTVPYAVGRETLFARLQQFSARMYTPLLVEGLTFWQQGDSNYWGHNAVVRIAPFRAHCKLPVLAGREPWGGEILCHDVVEAGLMRGAGWDVWVLPQTMESYEALPANMVDFASRERRWCQGNLQHKGVLRHQQLRPVGRFHLAYGMAHYLAGPVAMLFLVLATLDAAAGWGFTHSLVLGGGAANLGLAGLMLALLYAGKLLSLAAVFADREAARQFGGRARLVVSAVLEQVGAFVIAAALMVFYSGFVLDLLRGRTVRWDAQPRDDRGLSWSEGWLRMRVPFVLGAAWMVALAAIDPHLLAWAAPLLFGLLAVVPASVLSSRVTLGASARRLGLLLMPEEVSPPPVLRAYQRACVQPEPVRTRPVAASLHLATSAADGT